MSCRLYLCPEGQSFTLHLIKTSQKNAVRHRVTDGKSPTTLTVYAVTAILQTFTLFHNIFHIRLQVN